MLVQCGTDTEKSLESMTASEHGEGGSRCGQQCNRLEREGRTAGVNGGRRGEQ